ncbi:MAG: NO-inducible flavohemoprotein [Planctomycetaceae bacterium]|nr:NO-inducible flavohemoprotein [Planctomycetaceae bacterium]MCP4479479.1 NO-inducible flavohemoprotein [Planctomycetaceae bacterium]
MLSQKTIDIIKQITPLVAENAKAITRRFYELMFDGDPEVRAFFNMAHQESGQQPEALANAVCAYFSAIENLDTLGPVVELIAQKHCSLNVQPEHYPIVGKYLLAAIKDVLGDPASDEIIEAVAEAYGLLAEVCINREKEIYAQQHAGDGGWSGYRKFVVQRKEIESHEITSFYLKPEDGQPLPSFKPGQYITVQIDHPVTPTSPRNYSLSDSAEKGYFRISVKREVAKVPNAPDGLISNYLHDEIQVGDSLNVGPPCGEFTLDPSTVGDQPIAFLAGGVGITPLLSMAKTLVDYAVLSPIYFIHASRNSSVHAFSLEVNQMISDKDFVSTFFVYDDPLDTDVENGKCDATGFLNTEFIRMNTPHQDARFYICGPKPFMEQALESLKELGVCESRIHYEFFGPKQELVSTASV